MNKKMNKSIAIIFLCLLCLSCYETEGCTDQNACNYLSSATIDDGSCEYNSCLGCTDQFACNYDPDASIDDGSCDYGEYCWDGSQRCDCDE